MEAATEEISGTVERVVFHNPETGWSVLRLRPGTTDRQVTVVGTVPGAHEGAALSAQGAWRDDPAWGHQFVAQSIALVPPDDEDSLVGFLASGVVKGLGKRLARRLVRSFGLDVLSVIEQHPERLAAVRGMTEELRRRLVDNVGRHRHLRELVAFLDSHGLGAVRATRILDTYGGKAIERVLRNPWGLARDVRGIGFRGADELARRLGVDPASPERLAAGLAHVLEEAAGVGDTAIPEPRAIDELIRLTGCTPELAGDALERQLRVGEVVVAAQDTAGRMVMEADLDRAERQTVASLFRLAGQPLPWQVTDRSEALLRAEAALGHPLAFSQAAALGAMLTTKVMVVTGGPGTGKTTLVRGLLAALPTAVLRVQLAAPTGRAARRLAESTGGEARTLHRLLEAEPGRAFRRSAARPLECDLVVVDEMSMVDLPLMAALVAALPDEAALLLVGDADQLPSVGPGQVLSDLVASDVVPVLRLTEIFRQAADSGIVANAHRINHGETPVFARSDEQGDFYGVRIEGAEDTEAKLVELVAERIPQRFGLDPVTEVQVLCPVNRGPLGTRELNRKLQARLNPEPAAVHERGETRYAVGDKVMQVENDYGREVWNGDIGRITAIRERARELDVELDGRTLVYGFDELDQLVPAYAITVHKSQGSEYPAVVMPLSRLYGRMLQRRLLYTAVSRAKRLVVLLAEPAALERAVQGRAERPRLTLLAQRLRQHKETS